jgi:hypothetical protein
VVKLVVKVDDGTGKPATATAWSSSGLDATGTPGLLSADPALTLKRGEKRWIGCNVQGGAGTRPTLRCLNMRHGPAPSGSGAVACWQATSETADTFGAPSAATVNPVAIVVRRS